MLMRTLAVGAVSLALALAACGDGESDSGADGAAAQDGGADVREQFVDAVATAEAGQDTPLAGDDVRCFAEAVVDAIGVDELQAAMTPEEIVQAGSFDPVAAGVEVTEDDAAAVVDAVSECVDLRQLFLDEVAADDALSPEQVACVDESVDDELLEAFIASAFISGDAQTDPETLDELQVAVMPCMGG
jgi:hypothetical protein